MAAIGRPVVLAVDDDPGHLEMYQSFFSLSGYQVETASNVEQGIELIDKGREISLALIDWHLDHPNDDSVGMGMSAPILFRHIRNRAWHRMRGYAYTADRSQAVKVQAIHSGAFRVLYKTIDTLDLIVTLMEMDYELLRGNVWDPRSELFNFHGFRQAVISALEAARVRPDNHRVLHSPSVFSMLFIDVYKFKKINDVYGHDAGDKAIRFVAQAIRKHTRRGDYDCRVAGDEFALCLPNVDEAHALIRAQEIRDAVAATQLILNGDQGLKIELSIGLAVLPREDIKDDVAESFRELLDVADRRMYEDKERQKKEKGEE